ncbi:hypothetical protein AX760_11755 [Pararhizobium antarcticum]|uniref:Esterase n=2 Tax=Pararhizobium antarcticum TaxID=1798805 RepID=A0A657M0K2_9HYPH|nr:hypothetical protein AX761_07240 [Rhizobium sp. 58]OJF99817.1 hypothetical protein AX760_11755 [Pararhizobium antarcticum]
MCSIVSNKPNRLSYRIAVVAVLLSLGGCASRPTSAVLQPTAVAQAEQADIDKVALLSVTNRNRIKEYSGFGTQWAGELTYERYGFAVPRDRKGATIAYPTERAGAKRTYMVTEREQLAQQAWLADATRSARADGTVAVYVHGYNNLYQEALYRAAQMAADAKTLSPPIVFSWPSAASVTGYVTDRDAALYSRTDLEGVLTALARAPGIKRVVLFGHSMGGFLSMEATRQLKLQGRDDVIAKLQVVLAAPDIDVDVFRSQLRDIGHLKTPITVLASKTDRALSMSSFIGGERARIGRLDINDPVVQEQARKANVNIVDISTADSSDGLGHDRFAAVARFGSDFEKAEALQHKSGNFRALVFDAAGAAVASPFRLVGHIGQQ